MAFSEMEQRPYSRETSDLQRRLDEVARLEKLEEDGIHAHGLIKQEDPTLGKIIFVRAIKRLHRSITSKRP